MKRKKNKASKPADIPDEPYRYSLELVATIAARFVDGNTSDKAATARAIAFLDNVEKTIAGKMVWIRARQEAEWLSGQAPKPKRNEKHIRFAAGIRWVTDAGSEANAIKPFRDYLRLNSRLSKMGRPSQLTDEQAGELLEPLATSAERAAEDAWIEQRIADYRREGFGNATIVSIKLDRERLQAGLVIPYQNSTKGKSGGRPPGSKKRREKSLVPKSAVKKRIRVFWQCD